MRVPIAPCSLSTLFSSVQFIYSVLSDSSWTHGLQHARIPCQSPTSRACSNSYPSSQWCHLTISSSVTPFSCLQSFPASGSFQMSQFFASGGQNTGVSASAWPSNEYSGLVSFRIDWFDLLAVQGTLKSLPKPQFQNINFSVHSLLYGSTLTFKHDYWKNHSFD